eukprot:m51a1_g7523 hypothetical protein (427) ;mRNA; f:26236-27625
MESAVYHLSQNEGVLNQFNYSQIAAWSVVAGPGVQTLTRDALARACAAVAHRHPLVRGRRSTTRPFEIALTDDCTVPVTLQRCGGRAEAWREYLRQVKDVEWDSEYMLQVDAYQYEDANNGAHVALILHTNHAVADGFAVQVILRDLVCALDGRALEPQPTPRPFYERFPDLHDNTVSEQQWNVLSKNASERVREVRGLPMCNAHFHTFSEAETTAIVKASKAHGVTVTALLMAAGSLGAERADINFAVVVTVRPPSASSEVSYSVTIMPLERAALPPPPATKEKTWEAARMFAGVVHGKLARGEHLKSRMAVDMYRGLAAPVVDAPECGVYHADRPAYMSVSSMGVFDKNLALPAEVAARWSIDEIAVTCCNYVALSPPNLFCFTYRGRLTVVCTSTCPPVAPANSERFFERVIGLMTSSCSPAI